jgi:HK97 gp10 family phage protein
MKVPKNVTPEQFAKILEDKKKALIPALEKTTGLCCKKIASDIQESMAKTSRNMERSYYTHNKKIPHHPSLPGNPPAPDTGNLRNSIRWEVSSEKEIVTGRVGSTQKEPPYGVYLEFGTSVIAPRPWLRPAMRNNENFIKKNVSSTVKKILEGVE